MKKQILALMITAAFYCVGCAIGTDQLSDTNSASSGEKQIMGSRRCGKGFILTASQTDSDWLFVLKPNWNRGARPDEITEARGLANTKQMLGTIAPDELIYWYPWQKNPPPNALLVELREHCKKVGLHADGFPSEATRTDNKSVQATK